MGVEAMAHASVRGPQSGRLLALASGFLAVCGLLAVLDRPSLAREPSKTEPAKTDKTEPAKTEPARVPAGVPAGSDMAEMIQVINEKIEAGWKDNNLTPSVRCTDYDFIRRASLDVIGRIAKPEEIDAYLKQPEATRRSWLIEELLKSEEYPRHWADLWTNWLLTRAGVFAHDDYHEEMHTWLEDQFAQNVPYSKLVTELITAKGKNTDNGAVNFILAHVGEKAPQNAKPSEVGQFEMVPITSRITRLFLGTQTQCTQCHDHPFDARLKQNHFWGINAFMRQVERKGNPPEMRGNRMMKATALELVVNTDFNQNGRVFYEKRNGVVLETKPVFLDGTKVSDVKNDRREELAKLIVDHEMFGKAFVNRMWAHFMGRGFANPIDDFNDQNQPSHPKLLDELGKKFRHYGFDQKKLIRWICNSEPYNLSCVANKTNDKPDAEPFFSRMLMKTMSPEELFESLMVATKAVESTTKEGKKELRASWLDKLIANFGDDEGNEVTYTGTVVQALMMMNSGEINNAISSDKGTVALVVKAKNADPQKVIPELYKAALNRLPSQKEYSKLMAVVNDRKTPVKDKSPNESYCDLFWALLNSNEFILNH
jgi:hypothetical protein